MSSFWDTLKRTVARKKQTDADNAFVPIKHLPMSIKQGLVVSSSLQTRQQNSSRLWAMMLPVNSVFRYLPQMIVRPTFKNPSRSTYHFLLEVSQFATLEKHEVATDKNNYDKPYKYNVEREYPFCFLYAVPQTSEVTMTRCIGPSMRGIDSTNCSDLSFVSDASGQCVSNAYFNRKTLQFTYDKNEAMMVYPDEVTIDDSLVETNTMLFDNLTRVHGPNQSKYWAMVFLKIILPMTNVSDNYKLHYQSLIFGSISLIEGDPNMMGELYRLESNLLKTVLSDAANVAQSVYNIMLPLNYGKLIDSNGGDTPMYNTIDDDVSVTQFVPPAKWQPGYDEDDSDDADYSSIPFYDNVPDMAGYMTLTTMDQNIAQIIGVDSDLADADRSNRQTLMINIYMQDLGNVSYVVFSQHDTLTVINDLVPFQKTPLCVLLFRPKPGYTPW